jgi:hypothetical protein
LVYAAAGSAVCKNNGCSIVIGSLHAFVSVIAWLEVQGTLVEGSLSGCTREERRCDYEGCERHRRNGLKECFLIKERLCDDLEAREGEMGEDKGGMLVNV